MGPIEAEIAAFERFQDLPEVLPEDRYHDGWDGAAGAERRDDPYMPYPHGWDYSLDWCRIRFAMHYSQFDGHFMEVMERPPDKIPGWIYRRALLYAEKHYGHG